MTRLHPFFIPTLGAAAIVFCVSGCLLKPTGANEPADVPSLTDIDNDNTPDISDNDIDGDGKTNITDADIDGDNIPNTQDPDIDGDGIINIDDTDINGDGKVNVVDGDIDGDGIPNTSDADIDGDGVINIDDNDIDGDGIPNTSDSDIDGDGVVNGVDIDLDNDGVANTDDNDIDGDGITNNQDADIDNDGTANGADSTPGATGTDTDGTQGTTNTGADADTGTVNTGTDRNTGDTDADIDVPGIGVVAVDTVSYTLKIPAAQGTGTVTTRETIDLGRVREEIENNDIVLSTFDLTGLNIIASASNNFITANSDKRIVVTMSYLDASNNKIPVLGSAAVNGPVASVITVSDLAEGLRMNDELFAKAGGYTSFTNMIKDESKSTVETIIDIEFLDAPTGDGTSLDVDFILRATGIQPF